MRNKHWYRAKSSKLLVPKSSVLADALYLLYHIVDFRKVCPRSGGAPEAL
jgi:hypothetical protein